MAVAGLHNVSAFGPFFGETQSPRQWGDEPGTPGTRASSLLQMWRELEGEHVVSRSHRLGGHRNDNGHDVVEDVDEAENQVITGSETDHDDNNSIISEQSGDLGEIERERVRQIFREWMNSGAVSPSSNEFHLSNRSGPQWLGENECERVRIIREWVQMNSQQRNSQDSGSQIEQVRDGLAVTHPEIGARRPIRRLCGRQTLLDLLQRAQCERKEELQSLLEQKPVSDFTHRNRIQAFLRGRFLRNERVISNERPSSVAATELGMLRQRHTVSGLREGFLSKLEKSTSSTSANSTESDLWFGDPNNCESESTCMESETMRIFTTSDSEIVADGDRSEHESVREITEVEDPILPNMGNEQVSSENEEHVLEVSLCVEENQQEETNATITNELPLEAEDINQSRPIEASHEHYQPRSESSVHEAVTRIAHLEGNTDEFHESLTETEDGARQQLNSVAHTEWVDSSGESIARSWHESSANQLLSQTSHNNAIEQDQMQESHEDWPSHDLQEAIDSWLDMPSGEVGSSVGRMDTFYFSDDDNVHSIELRELFSRRRVSSLLRSGFRESLDQVLQSHMERLGHASHDWELDNASSSTSLADQEHEQQNSNQPLDISSASQPLWDEEMQGASLPLNNLNHHLGMDWEVVNELRMDMARLQERLNNMQSMLEQCMDMQIELQRSVRQEVSAALNRSILTRVGITVHDESQLDYVRRGICCLCHDSNIDSLLHRCGHMCTCSKCAEMLTHDKTGKCPMCRAPVVEAVRAYFIQ